jgi:hypothetical protein
MVEDRVTDGRRIAKLLASELHGREDAALARVAVVDVRESLRDSGADQERSTSGGALEDLESTADGAFAYRVEADGEPLAAVHVHPDRVHLAFSTGQDAAADTPGVAAEVAAAADLRVRPKAVDPPQTLVFVESGAAVKRAVDVVIASATVSR